VDLQNVGRSYIKPIPENEDGQYVWIEIKAVEITEITNHH